MTVGTAMVLGAFGVAPAAAGQCQREDVVHFVQGVAQVNTTVSCDDIVPPTVPVDVQGPRDSDLDPLCVQEALTNNVQPFVYCEPVSDPDVPSPEPTPGHVLRAFRELPLPAAELVVQPPGGRTLVNFATNFYTAQGEFTRVVTLLGRRVELRIWPSRFGWRFGDGESAESVSPGAAYPDLEITHEYRRAGRVSPSVDVTYAARFRVGSGPWREVGGTVTVPGSPVPLRVVEARPVLVGG